MSGWLVPFIVLLSLCITSRIIPLNWQVGGSTGCPVACPRNFYKQPRYVWQERHLSVPTCMDGINCIMGADGQSYCQVVR